MRMVMKLSKSVKENKMKNLNQAEDFADTIFRLRTERDLTQKNLADIIQVSDRTISKWENGQTVPDLVNIKNICDELGVSPSSLIHNKPTIKDFVTNIKRKLERTFNYLLKNIFLVLFVVMFILLLIFFINNYNSISIYKLKYDNSNINIEHGFFLKSDTINMLVIDNICIKNIKYELKSIKLELYTYVEGDKYILVSSDNLNDIFIEEQNKYPVILTNSAIVGIMKNMYLDITAIDSKDNKYSYSSIISLKDKITNDKLTYERIHKDSKYSITELTFTNNKYLDVYAKPVSKDPLLELGYEFDENNNFYIKVDEFGGTIKYYPLVYNLKYTINLDGKIIEIFYDLKQGVELRVVKKNSYIKYDCNVQNSKNKICQKYSEEIARVISIFEELT